MDKFKRYLWLSQINLFGWLILSSFIVSSVVFTNGGVSNYGNHYSTVIFYSFAFLADAIYTFLAARLLISMNQKFKSLALYLKILSMLLLLVFITTFPRRFGAVYSDIHDNISKVLFAYESLLGFWLVYKRPVLETIGYMLIMAGGSIVALLSSLHVVKLMFVGQMAGALGFALLLAIILPKVVAKELKVRSSR
jgi:hypothetical protein